MTVQTLTLAEFLLARIAEDERAARGTGPHSTRVMGLGSDDWPGMVAALRPYMNIGNATHIARWDPARVLAECDAKRLIIEPLVAGMPEEDVMDGFEHEGWDAATRLTLRLLALPYSTHPDFRSEWPDATEA